MEIREGIALHKNREKPIKLLLTWAGSDKWYLFASVFCAFLSGLFVIGPYVGIFHLMDAVLLGTLTRKGLTDCIVLVSVTTVFRMVLLGLSGVLSHKGAYNALFRVRCMIIEKLAKVPLGYVSERRTGEIKTVLNENIEKLELCLAHNIPELVSYLTGPVVIFMYLMTVNIPLALISLIPLFFGYPGDDGGVSKNVCPITGDQLLSRRLQFRHGRICPRYASH